MAETAIKSIKCRACNAEVRVGSAFCYSCGEPVNADDVRTDSELTAGLSNNGKLAAERMAEPTEVLPVGAIDAKIAGDAKGHNRPDKKPALRSAASIRKATKASNRKPVEVIWVPREASRAFVIVTLILFAVAFLLLAAALYIK